MQAFESELPIAGPFVRLRANFERKSPSSPLTTIVVSVNFIAVLKNFVVDGEFVVAWFGTFLLYLERSCCRLRYTCYGGRQHILHFPQNAGENSRFCAPYR